MENINRYELITDYEFKNSYHNKFIKGIKKLSEKDNIEIFPNFYTYLEKFLPVRAYHKSGTISIFPFPFYKIRYNRMMLFTNGESIHDIVSGLKEQTGEKCFLFFTVEFFYHFNKYVYISESGKFFYSDGTYLGNDVDELCTNIFEKRIGIHQFICDRIFLTLRRQGWNKSRKADISHIRDEFEKKGKEFFPTAERFFEEFTGIRIKFWFGGYYSREHIIGSERTYITSNREAIQKRINEDVICIGSEDEFTYFIGRSGAFYISFHDSICNIGNDQFAFLTWLAME